ncbi:MAG: helicase-associated domain-containing protein [Spirochaetales bacterium]|nr:helicase-associated domain-containing protein [Spirochaetales bacterium]
MINPSNPLIVQSDNSLLLEVYNPIFETVRNKLSKFAELVKSPEHIHTYFISSISIWNASASGVTLEEIISTIENYSKFDVPQNVIENIKTIYQRFGKIELIKGQSDEELLLNIKEKNIELEILANPKLKKYLQIKDNSGKYKISLEVRGDLKVDFFNYNLPINDIAGYTPGKSLDINLRETTSENKPFSLREYQKLASESFYQAGTNFGGHGTIVLPCGSGKTIIGIDILVKVKMYTLILATSVASVHQWIREILDKTTIASEQIGEYTGDKKEIKPITVTTYQMLIYRKKQTEDFPHFGIFQAQDWGLIIYDEVHLLPAPVFKVTSGIQSKRRLGLTATLVREDSHEKDVFCLIGPKRFDTPWKVLEKQGWISEALCHEIKLPLPEDEMIDYLTADQKSKFAQSSQNPYKIDAVKDILLKHQNQQILIIGQYIEQLKVVAKELNVPMITGKTPNAERENLYAKFRSKEIRILVVSKIANFSIDLPDASVLLQISGTYGSRQEEAQRLGRILRPKEENVSYFYTFTTKDSLEEDYAHKRQRFLTEQGYSYQIDYWEPRK